MYTQEPFLYESMVNYQNLEKYLFSAANDSERSSKVRSILLHGGQENVDGLARSVQACQGRLPDHLFLNRFLTNLAFSKFTE